MKKLITSAILASSMLSFGAAAQCVVSNTVSSPTFYMNKQNTRMSLLFLSNISDESIQVSVELYDRNGNLFANSSADAVNGLSGFPTQSGGITMPAKSSGYMAMYGNSIERIGHAEITWESSVCLDQAMTASVEMQWLPSVGLTRTDVNGGAPF